MATPCKLCIHPDQRAVERAFNEGLTDRVIGKMFNVSHMCAHRHRKAHIIAPAQHRLAIVNKASLEANAREERARLAAAATSDAPSTQALIEATLGMRRQMEKLNAIEARLERMASASEQTGSTTGVSQLSAQQLRSIEVGAKLGSVGGYKPPSVASPTAEKATVSIEFVFQTAPKETIALTGRPVLDGDVIDLGEGANVPSPHPSQKFQGSVSDYWDFSERRPARSKDDPEGD